MDLTAVVYCPPNPLLVTAIPASPDERAAGILDYRQMLTYNSLITSSSDS